MTDAESKELDNLFAEMRDDMLTPSDDLMARVLADADALQPDAPAFVPAEPKSSWAGFMELIGGWPALSGVAAAGVAGLWLGVAPPASVEQIASDVLGTTESVSLFSDFGGLMGEFTDG